MYNLAEGSVEDITEKVTQKVTERDIKLSVQIARDAGATEQQIPAIIAKKFEKSEEAVKRIIYS